MMRVCPDCLTAPAGDQRPQAKNGRCADCQASYGLRPRHYDDPLWIA